MFAVRRLQNACLWLCVISCGAMACSIPGIRPEGRSATISASAPAASAEVYARARDWFGRNRFTWARDDGNAELRGYSLIRTDGDIETRAVVDFTITGSTIAGTSYRISGFTERGRPPAFTRSEQNASETESAVSSLASWLSCPSARWARCP
jgi:hypothetical protein